MREKTFGRIFIGFLLVFIEIHFLALDILADPIGYLLIASGLIALRDETGSFKKLHQLAYGLAILSIPTVFIQSTNDPFAMANPLVYSGYSLLMALFKIVLVYYLLTGMMKLAEDYGWEAGRQSVEKVFKIYLPIALAGAVLQPFTLNMNPDWMPVIIILMVILYLIAEIALLVVLFSFRKNFPAEPPAQQTFDQI